jgi:phospholipid-binding lipoprotein MlaA
MEKQREDFGQTLGVWGVGAGPYLVLPILGPNTVRSAGGFAVDAGIRMAVMTAIDPFENVDNGDAIEAGIFVLEAIDMRHREKFRYYDSGHPFEYEIVRFISAKRLELDTMK